MFKIIIAPNPVLSKSTKRISKINKQVLNLVEEMKKTLLSAKDPIGVGLAAPQIGKSLRIFIAKPTGKSKIMVFINPKIIQKTKVSHLTIDSDRGQLLNTSSKESERESKETKLEGCLSLLNIWGNVKRNSEVVLSYLDAKGQSHTKTFNGFLATVIQHEIDHLDGILFTKRVLEQKGTLYKSHKNAKNEDEFEEIEI